MNTTSKREVTYKLQKRGRYGLSAAWLRPGLGLIPLAFLLGACIIQGPWDYRPENPPEFKGITASVYLVADRPISDVCFERLLSLEEGKTTAFAWYDSAEVGVSGRFSDGGKTLVLKPKPLSPNCFTGDPTAKPLRNEEYDLKARFVWDSAGKQIVTTLSATAKMPDSFKVARSAAAPTISFIGGFGGSIFNLNLLQKLPAKIQSQLQSEFSKEFAELSRLLTQVDTAGKPDTLATAAFFSKNGERISKRIVELVQNDLKGYKEGDTLFYISNKELNTTSHYFATTRSPDVQSVLITQRFDSNASRIVTAFDGILGLKPESSSFYYPGDIRRLLLYPSAPDTKRGINLLDSLGVVNTWYFTNRNRLYFYGFDSSYYQYHSTTTQDDNPKLKPRGNVVGGRGFFSAAIVDSFDVFIEADPADKQYPLAITHGLSCQKDGWFDNLDCRNYYRPYCRLEKWGPEKCGLDAIMACDEKTEDSLTLDSLCVKGGPKDSAMTKADLVDEAHTRYCTDQNYPLSQPYCKSVQVQCEETPGLNRCKEILWQMCEQRAWTPAACKIGRISYCREGVRPAEAACRDLRSICSQSNAPKACQF